MGQNQSKNNHSMNILPQKIIWVKNVYYYEGEYIKEYSQILRHGYGICIYITGISYEGYWKRDFRVGNGKMTFPNGDVFKGNFYIGPTNGTIFYKNGDIYTGNVVEHYNSGRPFANSVDILDSLFMTPISIMRHNEKFTNVKNEEISNIDGEMKYANGDCYVGQWKYNLYHGEGKLTKANGNVYDGVFRGGNFDDGNMYIKGEDGRLVISLVYVEGVIHKENSNCVNQHRKDSRNENLCLDNLCLDNLRSDDSPEEEMKSIDIEISPLLKH